MKCIIGNGDSRLKWLGMELDIDRRPYHDPIEILDATTIRYAINKSNLPNYINICCALGRPSEHVAAMKVCNRIFYAVAYPLADVFGYVDRGLIAVMERVGDRNLKIHGFVIGDGSVRGLTIAASNAHSGDMVDVSRCNFTLMEYIDQNKTRQSTTVIIDANALCNQTNQTHRQIAIHNDKGGA